MCKGVKWGNCLRIWSYGRIGMERERIWEGSKFSGFY